MIHLRQESAFMRELIDELYPICRSITGDGVRRTLEILRRFVPLEVVEIPSGTEVFDWMVPDEWNVRGAWIKGPLDEGGGGETVVDFQDHNLHLLNYSAPIRQSMQLHDLDEHLHSLPDQPDLIPYRTSYYNETWGFCLPHRQRQELSEGTYEVEVDSTLEPGHLTYGEYLVRGRRQEEILISCHICHPSLANDNLSGIAVATRLAKRLTEVELDYTYRFLFIPGTIGSITWLARNEEVAQRVHGGLVAANLGDSGRFNYKRSRRGNAPIDRAVALALEESGEPYAIENFVPYGYDERQYCSPGFDLAIGSLTRTPYGRYPEYHTSGDNLDFVQDDELAASLEMYLATVDILEGGRDLHPVDHEEEPVGPEGERILISTNPKCEPQLGRRGLYGSIGGSESGREEQLAMLWVLNLADGKHSLGDMAARSGIAVETLQRIADRLQEAGLLVEQ